MFRVDRSRNRLSRLVQKCFSDLNLRERDDLQEWMTNRAVGPDKIAWLSDHIQKLEAAFSEPLARLNRQIRTQDEEAI